MTRKDTISRWLPLAVAAAVGVTSPFMLMAVGFPLALLFLSCDLRPAWRWGGLLLLVPLGLASFLANPMLALYAAVAGLAAALLLRGNYFSSVTSSALSAALVAAAITVAVGLGPGAGQWRTIEQESRQVQQHWRQVAQEGDRLNQEQLESWDRWNELSLKLLPGQFALMMVAGVFITVLLFRRHGQTRQHLSLGCSRFGGYRFEDSWVWLVILSLAAVLLFRGNPWVARVVMNLLFVMGVLYALRGLAVIFHFVPRSRGGALFRVLVVSLCLTPLVLFHLLVGLLDTWADFRRSVPSTQP